MKQSTYLVLMIIGIALLATVCATNTANKAAVQLKVPSTKKCNCQSLALAAAICEKDYNACIEYKARFFDNTCPQLAQSVMLAQKEITLAGKIITGPKTVAKALTHIIQAADECPEAFELSNRVKTVIEVMKSHPTVSRKIAGIIISLPKNKLIFNNNQKSILRAYRKKILNAIRNAKYAITNAEKAAVKASLTRNPRDISRAKRLAKMAKRRILRALKIKKNAKFRRLSSRSKRKVKKLKKLLKKYQKRTKLLFAKAEALAKLAKKGDLKAIKKARRYSALAERSMEKILKMKNRLKRAVKKLRAGKGKSKLSKLFSKKVRKAKRLLRRLRIKAKLTRNPRDILKLKRAARKLKSLKKQIRSFKKSGEPEHKRLRRFMRQQRKIERKLLSKSLNMKEQANKLLDQARISKNPALARKAEKLLDKSEDLKEGYLNARELRKQAKHDLTYACGEDTAKDLRNTIRHEFRVVDRLHIRANHYAIKASKAVARANRKKNQKDGAYAYRMLQILKQAVHEAVRSVRELALAKKNLAIHLRNKVKDSIKLLKIQLEKAQKKANLTGLPHQRKLVLMMKMKISKANRRLMHSERRVNFMNNNYKAAMARIKSINNLLVDANKGKFIKNVEAVLIAKRRKKIEHSKHLAANAQDKARRLAAKLNRRAFKAELLASKFRTRKNIRRARILRAQARRAQRHYRLAVARLRKLSKKSMRMARRRITNLRKRVENARMRAKNATLRLKRNPRNMFLKNLALRLIRIYKELKALLLRSLRYFNRLIAIRDKRRRKNIRQAKLQYQKLLDLIRRLRRLLGIALAKARKTKSAKDWAYYRHLLFHYKATIKRAVSARKFSRKLSSHMNSSISRFVPVNCHFQKAADSLKSIFYGNTNNFKSQIRISSHAIKKKIK